MGHASDKEERHVHIFTVRPSEPTVSAGCTLELVVATTVLVTVSAVEIAPVKVDASTTELEAPGAEVLSSMKAAAHICWQEEVESPSGTLSQKRSSSLLKTAKPGSVAFACMTSCHRKFAALALVENAWAWKMTCTRQ